MLVQRRWAQVKISAQSACNNAMGFVGLVVAHRGEPRISGSRVVSGCRCPIFQFLVCAAELNCVSRTIVLHTLCTSMSCALDVVTKGDCCSQFLYAIDAHSCAFVAMPLFGSKGVSIAASARAVPAPTCPQSDD